MVTADAAFEQNNSSIFKQEAVQSRFAETLFRQILKKYIVWVNAVILWKKIVLSSITFLVRTFCYCNSGPSQHSCMQHYVLPRDAL